MKPKQILILSLILGVLVLGLIAKTLFRTLSASSSKETLPSFSFSTDKIQKIILGRGEEAAIIELYKQGPQWKVKTLWDVEADGEKIAALLKAVSSFKGELRSSDKNLFPDFGLEDQNAFSLEFFEDSQKPVLDLRIGSKKAGYSGFFVRKAGASEVYFVDWDVPKLLGIFTPFEEARPRNDFWADLNFLKFKIEDIQKITLLRTSENRKDLIVSVERENIPGDPSQNAWKYERNTYPFAADPGKILRFLATLTSLKAQKVVDPKGTGYGLEKPVWEMTLALKKGKEIVTLAGPADEKEKVRFIKNSVYPTVFQLQEYFFEDLDIDDSAFFKNNPLNFVPENAEKVVINGAKPFTLKPGMLPWEKYAEALRTFQVKRLFTGALSPNLFKAPAKYFIEIHEKDKTPLILDFYSEWSSGKGREHITLLRGNSQPFAVSHELYNQLFLIEEKPPVPPQAQS